MASAAVVGATMVGVSTVRSVVIGAAEVGVTSGVLYMIVWCSISATVIGVISGVLYGAAVVDTTVCARSNS